MLTDEELEKIKNRQSKAIHGDWFLDEIDCRLCCWVETSDLGESIIMA